MFAAFILIFIDLVLGVWRAKKVGEKITSKELRRSVNKICAYELAIISAFIVEKYMLDFPVVHSVTALIGLSEIKSIFENIHIITGIDFWQALTSKLQGKKEKEKH